MTGFGEKLAFFQKTAIMQNYRFRVKNDRFPFKRLGI